MLWLRYGDITFAFLYVYALGGKRRFTGTGKLSFIRHENKLFKNKEKIKIAISNEN